MAEDICLICELPFEENEKTTNAKKNAVQGLILASKQRRERKHIKYELKDKECVTVHSKCYKSYTSTSNIKACRIRQEAQFRRTSTRSTPSEFDFEQNCLFCGKDASEKFIQNQAKKKNSSKRQTVRNVAGEKLQESILRRAGERSDKWGGEVLDRVASVASLIAARARYHVFCHLRFFDSRSKSAAERSSEDTPHVIELIERFVKYHPDEHNFSLKEIIDSYEGKSASNKRLKKELRERLNDDIIIASSEGSEPTIHLRDVRNKILLKNVQDSQNERSDRIKIVTAAAKIIIEDIRAQKYDVETSNSSSKNVDEQVMPASLRMFLDNVVLDDKRETETGENLSKIASIAHAIISSVRPHSFSSHDNGATLDHSREQTLDESEPDAKKIKKGEKFK